MAKTKKEPAAEPQETSDHIEVETAKTDHDNSINVEREEVKTLKEQTPQQEAATHPVTADEIEARKLTIKAMCGIANMGIIAMTDSMSKGLVKPDEAVLNETEINTLCEVWARCIPTFNPMYLAIMATAGIAGTKFATVRSLYKTRKDKLENGKDKGSGAARNAIDEDGQNSR